MKEKTRIIAILLAIIILPVIFVFALLHSQSEMDNYYFNIAVDSHEEIYVGHLGYIAVFHNDGELIRKIKIHSSNGYSFNIMDDKLYIAVGNDHYTTDLYGNEIVSYLSNESKELVQIRSMNSFTTEDGVTYSLFNNRVYRDEGKGRKVLFEINEHSNFSTTTPFGATSVEYE